MGMNQTPASERVHIGLFGRRNAGKSSVINAVTNQDAAIVSEIRGTTTDPVYKAMELLPLGPVMLIDTPGLDDEGELGALRVQKSLDVLRKTDIALLIVDGSSGMGPEDEQLEAELQKRGLPYLVVFNKMDLCKEDFYKKDFNKKDFCKKDERHIWVSARTGEGIEELKERLARLVPEKGRGKHLVGDLLDPLDLVVLVVPIDKAAPKGRLILPQQQTIRDVLESGAISVVTRDTELSETLSRLGRRPKLVITDSQVFDLADKEDALPAQLSGGQMQRVCIARALAGGAQLILADEPTGNLDSKSGSAVMDVFRTLAQEGVTVVMVTHNKEFAARCDRVIELKDGRVQ